ncbi:MAG: tRNA pseudouridine(38-40) synthase TruA [Candidatus Kinetoplastibacterium crithidii]|nr:MAG: tRNA pseudouridine(38-40) synthase TruA [Candidatus Kinetoplastibacterium crithidii]
MNRIALGLSYNGSFFYGWQSQPNCHSIQDILESAISKFASVNEKIKTICAGRTDRDVHAISQIVHFDTKLERNMISWVRGVNAFLPKNISIHWAKNITTDFHARFSAISRTYTYVLYCGSIRPSIYHDLVGWCMYDLNIDKMIEASSYLIGLHDFSSFRASRCQSNTSVREIYRFDIKKKGSFIIFTIEANSFLYHMVRNIVGVMIEIGRSIKNIEWMKELLEMKNRSFAAPTFSPNGLYLLSVKYPDYFNLSSDIFKSSVIFPF